MFAAVIPIFGAFDVWRSSARSFAESGTAPELISWRREGQDLGLFEEDWQPTANKVRRLVVTKDFLSVAEAVVCHSDPQAFDVLYQVLLRLQDNPGLMQEEGDADVSRLRDFASAVRRDSHKMKAFVRFKDVGVSELGRRQFASWFEPSHFIVDRTSPFFARRFADMDWIIATPKGSAAFKHNALSHEPFAGRPPEVTDSYDDLWRTYFANIFNPARLNEKQMQSEMPKKYWRNLPEAQLIPDLIANAERRVRSMRDATPTPIPKHIHKIKAATAPAASIESNYATLSDLKMAASRCQLCPLHANATQTVCGEGANHAQIMFVGEQPGDNEDLEGRPFIGPAGEIFNAALMQAGISRDDVYVTNAVKHFKFNPRGKRRIHARPNTSEIQACKWWLSHEISLVKPNTIVALGATALHALTGDGKGISQRRGRVVQLPTGQSLIITYHPSAILRTADRVAAAQMRHEFESDIFLAATNLDIAKSPNRG